MTRTAKPNLAWLVQVEENYGTRHIRAHVMIVQENGELHNPLWGWTDPAREYAYFQVSAYLGNFSESMTGESTGGEVWGLHHEFAPHRVENAEQAKSMASVFGKVARGLKKSEDENGYVKDGDIHAYLLRIGAALGIRTYYVRNGKRQKEMSGETFRKVTPAALQWWVGDVSDIAANRPHELNINR